MPDEQSRTLRQEDSPLRRLVVEKWDIPERGGPMRPVMPRGWVEASDGLWLSPDGEMVQPITPMEAP